MGTIVQKYGGSSVASTEQIKAIAARVCRTKRSGHRLVVVVSAMGDATDELLAKARAVSGQPDRRELDMLLSVGERITMSLLAMAIREEGEEAVSLTGSQSGIITTASHTNARIMEVRPFRVQDELDAGRVVIVAGYQGVSYKRDITTLGRGGSDTTAVALAAALDAEACEIYSDVDGIFTADPRVVPEAVKLDTIGYGEMQELAESGARVLNAQAVEFAKAQRIAIYAKRSGSSAEGTVVRTNAPAAPNGVRGIAHECQVFHIQAADTTLAAASRVLDAFVDLGVSAKQHHLAADGVGRVAFSCVVSADDLHGARALELAVAEHLGPDAWTAGLGAVSLVGEGITKDGNVLSRVLARLASDGVQVAGISTSSFRITMLVPGVAVEPTVRLLHAMMGLGDAEVAVVG